MERRLAAILAADVKGYSRLTELNEEASTATLRMYRAVVEESISAHRGHVFSSAGDGVVAEFPSVVEAIDPNDADLLADMGNLLIYVGQPKQAIDQVKEAIRLNPLHATWYVYYLGWAYEEAGMPKEAIEIFEKAIDLQNPDEEQLWYFPTVAAAYADPTVGRMDDARKIVKTFLSRKPEFSTSKAVSRYPYKTKELLDSYVNAVRRAGLPE